MATTGREEREERAERERERAAFRNSASLLLKPSFAIRWGTHSGEITGHFAKTVVRPYIRNIFIVSAYLHMFYIRSMYKKL